MRRQARSALLAAGGGLGAGLLLWWAGGAVRLALHLLPTVLVTTLVAVLLWLILLRIDAADPTSWPYQRNLPRLSGTVRERGTARLIATMQSALRGSKLSAGEVEGILARRVADKLVARGADPAHPFADVESATSASLARLCRRVETGAPAAAVTRKSLSTHLKEIVTL